MKNFIVLPLALIIITFTQLLAQSPKPRILGVVMGISKYQNVPSLKYADRDALSFYDFLLSPAGGKADTNNIRLLLNEKATSYNFFEAMDNLLDLAKEGDQVYIYFAGHGDIEKKTERQNGFLICYSSPPNCYAAGGSILVTLLQDYVSSLVSKNKSKVTLIIDACRSGKLAGGSQGAEITALALQAEWKGVTKILSCQPGETSLEGDKWGDGAGVFTHFLLRGLKGLADDNKDGKVTVRELSQYLDKNVSTETQSKQIPQIVGDIRQDIAKVHEKTYFAELNQLNQPVKLSPNIQSAGFEIEVSTIPDETVSKLYEKFKEQISKNNLITYYEEDKEKENAYSIYQELEKNPKAKSIIGSMKGELLAALQNKAQIVMNGWIDGKQLDESTFNVVYKELKIANSLVDSSSTQFSQVKYKYLLWSGNLENDTTKQMKIFKECIKIDPDNPHAYFDLASLYQKLNDFDQAEKMLDKAIELSKNWSWAWYHKGLLLSDLNKFDEALNCYDRAIESKPNFDSAWNNKGYVLLNLGRYEESIVYFDKLIELNPDNYDGWFNKSLALFQLGKLEKALESLDACIKIKSDYYSAWFNKGCYLTEMKNYNEALICLDKSIELNPDSAKVWHIKGVVLLNMEKHNEGLMCIEKALEINPLMFDALSAKGFALRNLGKNEEAVKYFDKALEINPDDINALVGKGIYLFKSGKYEESLNWINKAIEIHPDYSGSWYSKACCYALMKNKPEMLKYLKKAIELEKKNKEDAKKDEDFKEYWNDPDFMELVK